jgi:hypothetical protein
MTTRADSTPPPTNPQMDPSTHKASVPAADLYREPTARAKARFSEKRKSKRFYRSAEFDLRS